MNKKTIGLVLLGVLIGTVAGPKLKTLPLLNKLP